MEIEEKMQESLDLKKLSEVASDLGLEVRKPISKDEAGLYVSKNGEQIKWDALEELGLTKI